MDDLFKTDINFPVLGVSCLPFITLHSIAIGTELQLLKVCASVSDKNNCASAGEGPSLNQLKFILMAINCLS